MTGFDDSAGFWLVAFGLLAGVGLLLALSLLGARRAALAPDLSADRQLYLDQIAGIARDLERGILDPAEAARLKTEIARRLLEADRAAGAPARAAGQARGALLLPGLAILAALAGTVALYNRMGVPGLPDLPLAGRLAEADARIAGRRDQESFVAALEPRADSVSDPEFARLMEALRSNVDPASSTDLKGLALLARNEATAGNYSAARLAQKRLIAVKASGVTAADHLMLAEIMISQTGGYVSPEAEAALRDALALEPQNGLGLYYTGLIQAQGGRFDKAFALWAPLVKNSPADASWLPALRAQIGDIAELAGINYTLPPAPIAEDQTRAMAGEMVERLAARLASEGGSAQEWAQLVWSLSVLGRENDAREILAEAITIFPGGEDRQMIDEAAKAAGLTEQAPE